MAERSNREERRKVRRTGVTAITGPIEDGIPALICLHPSYSSHAVLFMPYLARYHLPLPPNSLPIDYVFNSFQLVTDFPSSHLNLEQISPVPFFDPVTDFSSSFFHPLT
jgi:hypothetical protein